MNPNPNLDTHVAELGVLPPEDHGQLVGRADLPTPSLWQDRVKVKHKQTGREALIFRVDHSTCMFRAFYPDENRLSNRTEWEHFHNWELQLTFSPAELARQAAAVLLEEEIAKMDARSIGLARVLCDDEDPNKALAKFQLLVQSGMLTPLSTEAAEKLIAEPRVAKKAAKAKAEPKSEEE